MRRNQIDSADVVGIVNRAINREGSQLAFARKAGVSPQALHRQLNGQTAKGFTQDVLRAAGLKRTIVEQFEFLEDAHV